MYVQLEVDKPRYNPLPSLTRSSVTNVVCWDTIRGTVHMPHCQDNEAHGHGKKSMGQVTVVSSEKAAPPKEMVELLWQQLREAEREAAVERLVASTYVSTLHQNGVGPVPTATVSVNGISTNAKCRRMWIFYQELICWFNLIQSGDNEELAAQVIQDGEWRKRNMHPRIVWHLPQILIVLMESPLKKVSTSSLWLLVPQPRSQVRN